MKRFSDLAYTSPDYDLQKQKLTEFKARMLRAESYDELKNTWLAAKDSMLELNLMETIAYLRFTCSAESARYKADIDARGAGNAKLGGILNECSQILLNSKFSAEFEREFGSQIMAILKNQSARFSPEAGELIAEERRLVNEYMHLISSCGRTPEMNSRYYGILDSLIQIRTQLAALSGFKSYIDMAYRQNLRFDYGQTELASFREQVNQLFTPVCREINRGKEIKDTHTLFNGEAELLHAVQAMFHDISAESGVYIDDIMDNGYIDLAERPEKPSDYFACSMLPVIKMPFIIGNYTNNSYDALALIHELGHGFAFYTAARGQKLYDYHRASSSVNEIHSKTMEHFAYPYLKSFVGDSAGDSIRYHLYRNFDNLPYRCAIDEYEHELYKDPSLTRKQRCDLWAAAAEKYLPWVEINPEDVKNGVCWPNQLHLFAFPFYYIEYDIAQISVFEFYSRSKTDRKAAWSDYCRLCHNGGSKSYLELLRDSNLSSPFEKDSVSRICRPVLEDFSSLL